MKCNRTYRKLSLTARPPRHGGYFRPPHPAIATKPNRKISLKSQAFTYGLGTDEKAPVPPGRLGRILKATQMLDAGKPPADIYDAFVDGLSPSELKALELALRVVDVSRRRRSPATKAVSTQRLTRG